MRIQVFCDGPDCYCPMNAETCEQVTQDAFENLQDLMSWAKAEGHEVELQRWMWR